MRTLQYIRMKDDPARQLGILLVLELAFFGMSVMSFIASGSAPSLPLFGLVFGFLAIMAARARPGELRRKRALIDYVPNSPGVRAVLAISRRANVVGLTLLLGALLWMIWRFGDGISINGTDGVLLLLAASVVLFAQAAQGLIEYLAFAQLRRKLS